MSTEKKCSKCGVVKSLDDYHRDRKKRDGRCSSCKVCACEAGIRTYYRTKDANKEKWKQQKKRRDYADIMVRAVRRYTAKNPEKVRAHVALNNAVKRGKIVRQPCKECGAPKAHAHHHDYSKPFDVEWLCVVCHRREHRRTAVGIALAQEGK